MNGTRKWFHILVAAALAGFALPGYAATKQFSIAVSSSSSTTTLTYMNGSTGGGTNSNINSVWFVAPYAVSNVKFPANLTTANTTISPICETLSGGTCPAGTKISITYITGFGPGSSAAVTMNGAPPLNGAGACAGWTAQAFTGNALGGQNFLAPDGTITATAGPAASCVLQFVTQPANAQIGSNITSEVSNPVGTAVQVQALVNGAVATWFSGPVTLTPSSGTLSGGGPFNAINGVATFGKPPQATALTLGALGTYTLTASASGFTSVTSSPFKIFAGVLNCGQQFASSFTNPNNIAPDQPGYATGMRSGSNKDGVTSTCVPVLYTFANSILLPPYDQVQLSWDTTSQPNAAFMYTMNWRPRSVVTSNSGNAQPSPIGWPLMPRPGVAWLNTDGSNASVQGTPKFIPALACLSSKLPASYGTLQSDLVANVTSGQTITITGIAANPQSPYAVPAPGAPAVPAPPFPVVIANTVNGVQTTATERLTATSISGSVSPDPATVGSSYTGTYTITYNVTRGTAAEGFSTPAFHASGTAVVSTPLPIIPNDTTTFPAPYTVQRQAQMCVAEHGFLSFTIDANGNAQLLWTTTVIDIGDGYVQGNF